MTNQVFDAPFLEEAPIYTNMFDENGEMDYSWRAWFDSITRVTGRVIGFDEIFSSPPPAPPIIEGPVTVLRAPAYTTGERDLFRTASDGTIIYNKSTGRFNFREGGSWVTFTPVPA